MKAVALALAVALLGCKSAKEPQEDPPPPNDPKVEVPSTPPRVAPFSAEKLGAQKGYLAGGLVYAAVRVDRVQAFLQTLPVPPEVARDLAEAGAAFGLDFRVDDIRARFGIDKNAIVSMTIARPMAADAAELRADLTRGGPFLDALAMPEAPPPVAPPKVEIAWDGKTPDLKNPFSKKKTEKATVEKAIERPLPEPPLHELPPDTPDPLDPPDTPEPPKPSLEAIAHAEKFLAKAATLGIHSRIHVPTKDPNVMVSELQRLASRSAVERWEPLCRAIPRARACVGDSDMVTILREAKGALVIDVVVFSAPGKPDAPGRIAAATEAALATTVERPELAKLAGDAAAFLDINAVEDLVTVNALHRAIRSIEWTAVDDRRSTISRRLEEIEAIHKLKDAPLLYRGAAFEVVAEGGKIEARLRWELAEDQADNAKKLLVGPEQAADVPTIEALCEGAVACARSRGLPKPSTWRDSLATGVYAEEARKLQRTLDRGDEWSALLLFAGAWPNLVGAVTRWPAQEIGRGPEAAIANNLVDALGDIEGWGASLRSIAAQGGRGIHADYAVYARAKTQDVDLARTLMSFAELNPTDTAISGVEGKAQMVRLPVREVPAAAMLYHDPDKTHGWATLVDGPDRLGWLLNLPRDRAPDPSFYFEIPDLWRLASAEPSLGRELGFARGWLAGRELRMALHVVGGAPEFVAVSNVVGD